MPKKKVLFIGSFKNHAKDGAVGGQMYACSTLINSDLKTEFDWTLLDTTSRSVPPPPIYIRFIFAVKRVIISVYFLMFGSIDTVLLFTGSGFGFMEKGLIALFSKVLRKKVVLAPRSGHIIEDIKKNRIISRFILYVFDKCDVVVCQSHSWKVFFLSQREYSRTQFEVIENWIDTKYYQTEKTKGDNITFLFMGWLEKKKGVFDLIESIAKLNNKLDDRIKFEFAGDGSERIELEKFISVNKLSHRVKVLGWVLGKEKETLFKSVDVMVLPSYVEGYPNVLIEAMASKIAVIGTNVGGIPDLLQKGKSGIIISPGNIEELQQSILFFSEKTSNIEKFAEKGLKRVIEGNDISVAVQKFRSILT